MQKWINMVECMCTDPAREQEFNDWYDNIHLPDVLKTPGYVSAKRYYLKDNRNGRGRYLAIYEIETDDIEKTMKTRLSMREKDREAGRSNDVAIPNLLFTVWGDVLCKQISEYTPKKASLTKKRSHK